MATVLKRRHTLRGRSILPLIRRVREGLAPDAEPPRLLARISRDVAMDTMTQVIHCLQLFFKQLCKLLLSLFIQRYYIVYKEESKHVWFFLEQLADACMSHIIAAALEAFFPIVS